MEALLFFFILCHCSWQESAQSGRRLSWAENRKELRKRERGGKKEHSSTVLVSFPRHKAGNPSASDRLGLAPPLLRPLPEEPFSWRRPQEPSG